MGETTDHDCIANLASTPNQTVFSGSEVLVFLDCTECGDEFRVEYEYVEATPA